jgi:hypothetical protein
LAHQLTGGVSTLLEWDAKIPPFPVLHAEVLKARHHIGTQLADSIMAASKTDTETGADHNVAITHVSNGEPAVPHPLHHIPAQVL